MNLLRWILLKRGRSRDRRNTFNILDEHAESLSHVFDSSHWRLTGVRDLTLFFRALPSLVPKGSILCLTDGAWPGRVRNILDTISLNMESAQPANLSLEFAEAYYISTTEQNMVRLAELSEQSAAVEIALHLAVLIDDERLLEWFDLPFDPIYIAETIKRESVHHFSESVGGRYQKITFCDNRTPIDV